MTVINLPIEKLKQKVVKIKDTATERSYYPLLCSFIEDYAKNALKLRDPHATPEETSTQYEKHVGFPDITVRNGNDLIGWVEVKNPNENLNAEKFQEQFVRYKDSLENIIFTNLREWQLWQWMKEEGENNIDAKKTAELIFDLTSINGAGSGEFERFLTKFFDGHAHQTRTPKQLALALAKKTRLLSKQVEETLETHAKDSDLPKLKETFEKTLIQDISEHQFSNMVAETMAYSLFLAALEHSRRGNGTELTLTNAIDYLPTNVPILADLYSLIKKVAGTIPSIFEATRLLVDQLNASEIERIHQKLVEHKPGEDPVIQFYEPFLKEYDPKEREARGVYYTPKPVVDYIVKSVDWILRDKFGKKRGLADESVHPLDPATGTGTFLMSAMQEIYGNIKKENKALGEEMVRKEFNRVVLNHILKHFYGFELLIAPYAIAHLKLTLEVERLGFDFALTKGDGDKDNDRFKVYLANTLDDPEKPPLSLFGFDSIPQESESARKVKKDAPILAIVGNPPYSGVSQNIGDWIQDLLKDAYYNIEGVSLGERNPKWLQDDYVKFIRFSEWKIQKEGQGIIGMITNHGYVDNPTFRGMRHHLLKTFDEIYILDLHGNSLKKEKAPDGSKDENVFNIQVGTAICFFIKYRLPLKQRQIFFAEIWGTRLAKFTSLLEMKFENSDWKKIDPKSDSYLFNNKQTDTAYSNYEKITGVFNLNGVGITTARDNFVIDFEKTKILKNALAFRNSTGDDETVCRKLQIPIKKQWNIGNARKLIKSETDLEIFIQPISYRPFDNRYIFYHDSLVWRTVKKVMCHMEEPNLALLCKRQSKRSFSYIFVSNLICESCVFESAYANNSVLPLYLYTDKNSKQADLLENKGAREVNLDQKIIKEFGRKLELKWILDGRGDLVKTFGPEDVFYYIYALFHSPTYRTRYSEQLKIDFPRLPLTGKKDLFEKLTRYGNELVNLHLLGENPFDKSKTIFNEPNRWGVKIGGTKPEDLEDWKATDVRYDEKEKRVYVNKRQYFEGIEKEVWEFMIGGYQVCEKWLKDRKKAERSLSTDDLKHYMKIVVSLRETIRIMPEIDKVINFHGGWPNAFK